MIHGYISLSGLISFLIVQNFENKSHPSEQLHSEHLAIVNNLSMTNLPIYFINLLFDIEQPGNSEKLTKKFTIPKFD